MFGLFHHNAPSLTQALASIDTSTLNAADKALLASFISIAAHSSVSAAPVAPPPPPPVVKPSVVATSGDLSLYADGSIGSAAVDAYSAGYKGPGQVCYGLFLDDAEAVFPQINSDPVLGANVAYNRANLNSPLGAVSATFGVALQGYSATFADRSTGHVYVPGSVKALRGTLALRAKTTDIPALIDAWKAQGYYPVQVEQGGSGLPFA